MDGESRTDCSTASGFGLNVATALVKRSNWRVHLLDLNGVSGLKAAKSLGAAATFHKVNATIYSELSRTFDDIFRAEGRLDFVFGNAGIVERFNFYEQHPADKPPPELDMRVVEINLKAVYTTSYLALHYFRQSPSSDRALVLTASCGGLYNCPGSAMYSGTKRKIRKRLLDLADMSPDGVVGFTRSIARKYMDSGVRVNCICPGTVATGLLEAAAWKTFPQEYMTPVPVVVDAVLKLIDGETITDSKGCVVKNGSVFGKAVEISVNNFYFRDQPEFSDEAMATTMGSTNRDNIAPT